MAFVLSCALVAGIGLWAAQQHAQQPPDERHSAVQVEPRTAEELAMALELSVDVWSDRIVADHPVIVVLDPDGIAALDARGVPHEIVVDDIHAVAQAERARLDQRTAAVASTDWFGEYRDVQEVGNYLDVLGERHAPLANVRRFGASIEGWPIRAVEISRGGDIGIVLNGGQHAREWISVMVTMCIADRLLANQADPRIDRILDSVTFTIAPLVNPDGYAHSWSADRYWRKNRRGGYGVDLNRNYGVAWGQAGAGKTKRSQTYRGDHAFSEPETRAMRAVFERAKPSAHIDFHSFSQLILYPWSHKAAQSADHDEFAAMADRMSSAIYAEHGQRYEIGSGAGLYKASGTFTDWAYGDQGALSFVVELRPSRGRGGFVLPPAQIIPTCEESLAAVLEVAEWMIDRAERGSEP
jgi:hypothetical protein